jgi:hypothetical protein
LTLAIDLRNSDFGQENAFADEAAILKLLVQLVFESYFELFAGVFDDATVEGGEYIGDFATAKRADHLGNKALADVFPEFGGVGLVELEENRAFHRNAFAIPGAGGDGEIAENFFVGRVKALVDRIFESLGVEELGDLPKGNFEMEAGTIDALEDSPAPIVDTGDVAGRDGDEKSANDLIHQKRHD